MFSRFCNGSSALGKDAKDFDDPFKEISYSELKDHY